MLDKTVAVTAQRISAAGGRLVSEARCEHAVPALAERIRASQADLVLIAGASAITDRRDVLPAAIEAAGGAVEHFGMPVDPGNLLLLARQGERPVLGLPGCARSPKLNGFDWVLQRLAAGIPVHRADIMDMGVGGLLMEIPTRPQPRDAASPASKGGPGQVAAIVLGAGQSRRMGEENKLLALVDGRPMISHMVDAMLASRASPVIVVTGHEAERVRDALGDRPVQWCHNPDYADGLSTSLRAGLDALPEVEGVLVALADMPRIKAAQIDRLIAAFHPTEGRAICVPTVRGKRGNPVLFASRFVPEMRQVSGDVGARHLIGAHADEVVEIEMDDDADPPRHRHPGSTFGTARAGTVSPMAPGEPAAMQDDLYHQAILDLARQATGHGRLETPQASVRVDNPLCGDRVTLDLDMADGRVGAVRHQVRGCLLCQAAAAVIGARAPGQSAPALRENAERLRRLIVDGAGAEGGAATHGPVAGARGLRAGASPQEPARLRAAAVHGTRPGPGAGRLGLTARVPASSWL